MKKLKAFWAKMFHRPILLVVNTNKSNCLHVVEVDSSDEVEGLIGGLGISEERKTALMKIINIAFFSSDNIVAAGEIISKECLHANELFFMAVVLTHRMRDQQDPGSMIMKMMRGMKRD